MDVAGLVRAARRAAGEGQDAFADRAGVSERTLSALEAGRSDPRWSTVARLVAAGGMELCAVPVLPDAERELVEHLYRSTSYRLDRSLRGRGARWGAAQRRELGLLARCGPLELVGREAVGVWLPVETATPLLPVVLHSATMPDLHLPHLDVRVVSGPPDRVLVSVPCWTVRLLVPPPLVLATHPDCGAYADDLRTAAALLDAHRGRDLAGRRQAPHRDPREDAERSDVMLRRELRDRLLPTPYDSRAWRLGGAGSLARWLWTHPQQPR